ncbi:UNVERIFIED_ORG: hypothetical protein J2W74_001479 [Methylorubrum zatmanii]|nr:hypothetical protein [Methylorubrum extorquens]
MDHRTLDHALEAGGRLGVLTPIARQIREFGVDVFDEIAAQYVGLDVTGSHHRGSILIIDESEQEVFEGRVFVAALSGQGQGAVEGLLEAT